MTNHYHFIGIGGIGMSGLARILLNKGATVTGSDLSPNGITDSLKQAGAKLFFPHSADHVTETMTVVYSTDIKQDNPEFVKGRSLNLPLVHRSQLLCQLMEQQQPLLVAGTHGKTTTSALLAHLLIVAGKDPSFAVGGILNNGQSNGRWGQGVHFVAESDESDGSFLNYNGSGAIITNIENDHLNHWKTMEALIDGFHRFAKGITDKNQLVWCGDDPLLSQLKLPGTSYGFSKHNHLQILKWRQEGWSVIFDLSFKGQLYQDIQLSLIGKHNVSNGAAVFGLGLALGVEEKLIRSAFASFQGVKRRMEKKGGVRGVAVFDDYAHHPTKIKAALTAIKQAVGERRLVVAFQPHRFTRTQDCLEQYGSAFEKADELILTDIYSAREQPIEGITSQAILEKIKAFGSPHTSFVPRAEMADFLSNFLRPHDVLITMGAGDITQVGPQVIGKGIPPVKLAVLCGGASCEHEVSLMSTAQVMRHLNPNYYRIEKFKIERDGSWKWIKQDGQEQPLSFPELVSHLKQQELCFPVLHGTYGEDGALQGFLEILDLPYVGCDFRSAAICMDKSWTKQIVKHHGVDVVPFMELTSAQWETDRQGCIDRILTSFPFPLYVKPAHLGSSIGVHRAADLEQLTAALDQIVPLDYRFLIEQEIQAREMEFCVYGNDRIQTTPPSEIITHGKLHDYAGKYSDQPTPMVPIADLPIEVVEKGRQAAATAYRALGCSGFARIDFFLKGDTWVLNEINPIPGLTKTSAYPKMIEANQIDLSTHLDQLIIYSTHRKRTHDRKFKKT